VEVLALGVEAGKVGCIHVVAALVLGLEDRLDFLRAVCHRRFKSTPAFRPATAWRVDSIGTLAKRGLPFSTGVSLHKREPTARSNQRAN
jgi:hypothetical protein